YVATTRSGRTFTGILDAETTASITLRGQEGKEQTLLRNELDEFASTGKSLMPEGLEKDLSQQDLADLIAYLTEADQPAVGDAAAVARQLLDDKQPAADRQVLAGKSADRAAAVVAALTADMPADAKEEYRRIPWIWRV